MSNTHIWVSEEFAAKYKELESSASLAELTREVVKQKKIDIDSELSQLDEDLVRFKAACTIHKLEMGKVYDEQESNIQNLINDCWDIMPKAKANAQKLADQIQPLGDAVTGLQHSVDELKKDIGGIDFYGIEQMIQLADKLNAMDQATKDVFSFLAVNYKK